MMPSTRQYISHSSYGRFGGYLENQHFFGTLFLAIMLHIGGVALYQILPKEIVELVPVRVLNIKIGQPVSHSPVPQEQEAKSTREMHVPVATKKPVADVAKPAVKNKPKAPAPKAAVKKVVPQKRVPQKVQTKAAAKPKLPAITKGITIAEAALEKKAEAALSAKQYIREDSIPSRYTPTDKDENGATAPIKGEGSAIGNSQLGDAEIESRYTQTLSLWLNRYKIYPAEARSAGLGGTVMLRIRINRQGRIMRYYLERPSGHEMIDRAISSMVNAANPVPAVPPNYPDPRPYLEFLVPIHFKP